MKTLVKTINAYSFSELDVIARETAKTAILEKERLPEYFSEDLTQALSANFGLDNLKTYYSLSYCQGDGLCLYGKITYDELFNNGKFKNIAFKGIHYKQFNSLNSELLEIDFVHKGRYHHAYSVCIESHEYAPTDKQIEIIEKVVSNVKSWYITFCRNWENIGYKYFYDISDEDTEFISNEYGYLFTDKGALIDNDEYVELKTV